MNLLLKNHDREILRPLADRLAACAADPVNAERRSGWRDINDLKRHTRPMIWCNEEPWNELTAADAFLHCHCADPWLREVECRMRRTLYKWEHFQGDMIIDPFLIVHKVTNFDEMCGMKIEEETLGENGGIVSHDYETQFITPGDLAKIKFIDIVHDEEETLRRRELLQESCGDILEVRVEGHGFIHFTPWDKIAMWYNPMELLMDLVLKPELMHAIVDRYTNAMLHQLDQLEEQNLLSRCDDNRRIGSGGLGYVSALPGENFDAGHVRPINQWGNAMPQIFSEVSPEMHVEFALHYERKWLDRFGLVYYGCCEPLHNKLEILKTVKNLRKISVSPWANIEKTVRETDGRYVLSVKPNPALLAEAPFRPEHVREQLRPLVEVTAGLPTEFIVKDISTCGCEVKRITQMLQTLHELIDEYA